MLVGILEFVHAYGPPKIVQESIFTKNNTDDQLDNGAGHSKGLIQEQDVSIHRSTSVVTKLR